MKVLVFGVVPYSPHFETQLEVIEEHLQVGDEVTYISCDKSLDYCDSNPENDKLFCLGCTGKRANGIKALSAPIDIVPLSTLLAAVEPSGFSAKYDSVQDIWDIKYENFDIGEALLSSLFSHAGTIYPDLDKYRDYIERTLDSRVTLYHAIQHFLRQHPHDLAYIYNGRGATGRCFIRACESTGLSFYTHERGSSIDSYVLIKDTVIHNVNYFNKAIVEHWENNPDLATKEKIAAEFFQRMRKGVLTYSEANYLQHQLKDKVPEIWLERSPRYVFFTSTETEMSALNGFFNKRIYQSLIETLTRIVEDLAKANFTGVLLVRMHPNSHCEYESLRPRLEPLLKHAFLHLVPPREAADTYALLDSADKVLTTYSTIGIEGAYAGIPCISLERSFYDLLGSCHTPHSHEETMQMLLEPLPALSREGAIKYGYYTLTFGKKFRFVTMQGQNKCAFKGKKVRAPRWIDWATKVRRKFS